MVIDGHAHACGAYHDADSITVYMDAHTIDKVVLCGGEPNSVKDYGYPMLSNVFRSERLGYFFNKIICSVARRHKLSEYIDEQNNYVYELHAALPTSVYNAYWINPNEENCMEKLQQFYDEKGFSLIKMHQCWTKFDFECRSCHDILKWAGEHRMPVFIHLLSHQQANSFVRMANIYSDTYFIVAHMLGAMCMANQLTNRQVFWDLSAPQLYSVRILKAALKAYGVKRLILGSDTPYGKNNIQLNMLRLSKLNLTNEELNDITGNTISKLLGL